MSLNHCVRIQRNEWQCDLLLKVCLFFLFIQWFSCSILLKRRSFVAYEVSRIWRKYSHSRWRGTAIGCLLTASNAKEQSSKVILAFQDDKNWWTKRQCSNSNRLINWWCMELLYESMMQLLARDLKCIIKFSKICSFQHFLKILSTVEIV